jgi:NAD(P)-dependent dehydrogenase (short-subunit alcohol dehydrogenase family)
MRSEIAGLTVLITGAADGIGAAAARRLASEGAQLVLIDVQREKLEALAFDIGTMALSRVADITDLPALEQAVDAATARFGGIDVVVANAAIDAIGPTAEMDPETFDRVIEVNLLGTWRTLRATLPAMVGRPGYVLIVTSGGAVVPPPYQAPYSASKAALVALAHTLRIELRPPGGRVGVIWFGPIDTDHAHRSVDEPLMRHAMRRIPKGFLRYSPVDGAAKAIERAIVHRSRSVVYPASYAPLMLMAGPARRVMERWVSG